MKIIARPIIAAFILCLVFLNSEAPAEYAAADVEDGRYTLKIFSSLSNFYGGASTASKIPAIVLDTVLGIVWICKDIQVDKPLWKKIDVAKNANKLSSARKYTLEVPEYPNAMGGKLKISAVILDAEEGVAWTCKDIAEEGAGWFKIDLLKDIK